MRCAIYARVSTWEQEPENQLQELRRYADARNWTPVEYIDRGVSGAKDRRPALDRLVADARRRRFDVLVVWRLDRLGRNLKHLVTLLEEIQAVGIAVPPTPAINVNPARMAMGTLSALPIGGASRSGVKESTSEAVAPLKKTATRPKRHQGSKEGRKQLQIYQLRRKAERFGHSAFICKRTQVCGRSDHRYQHAFRQLHGADILF